MYQLVALGNADKIRTIKAIRTVLASDLKTTKAWVENLPWTFDSPELATELLAAGCEIDNTVQVLVAVGLWKDGEEWKSYAEGWELSDVSGKTEIKSSCESTIISNGLNKGEPIHWRFVEASVPLPILTELTVQGTVLDETE
jgi:hypothetical protein